MKLALALTALLSFPAFAYDDCTPQAWVAAKMSLDEQAKEFQFEESAVESAPDKKIIFLTGEYFEFTGYIYKATYKVKVTTDTACQVEQVAIEEVL